MHFPRNTKNPSVRVFQTFANFPKARKAVTLILLLAWVISMPCATVHAGDILRGGGSGTNSQRNAQSRSSAGASAAQSSNLRAKDRLANTTKIVNDMRALQAAARSATGSVPNGLTTGGLKVLTGPNAKWDGAKAPAQSGNIVNIQQTASQALLHWETFDVGSATTVNFDQSLGGVDSSKWIAFNKVFDPSAKPSQIRGKINADGQVYIINQNGIIFGAGSQVNARALVASALPINDNLIKNGLLNNKDAQFLFSALEVPGGSDGTPTFKPTDVPKTLGNVIVERGAKISSPELAGGNGGRVVLVGANVINQGEISTPAGQTILAAGLQVGFQSHNSSDPSLRGLDVWVGDVGDYAGTVTNTGLIEAKTGSILAVGKTIDQNGVLESTTAVNLNGRIDLIASYGAVGNPDFDKLSPATEIFIPQFTGSVNFGSGSLTRILPDYASDKSIPGTSLAQNSIMNIDGNQIHLAPRSLLFSPSGDVRIRAGSWIYRDNGDHVVSTGDTGNPDANTFSFLNGSIIIDDQSIVDVSGTPDAFVPIANNIMNIQLRGNELADSPLQRKQGLRGKTLTVDLRRSGTYAGRYWIGTPLGDATGMANIIQRNVAQMTTRGGSIKIQAGDDVNFSSGAELNVSGGYTRNEGGVIKTTRVLRNGRPIDISNATPDVIYDGIYKDVTTSESAKWGVTKSFSRSLPALPGYLEPAYIEGAAGGSISISAPKLQLKGQLLGQTITGPKQLNAPVGHSVISLTFSKQKINNTGSIVDISDDAPAVVFSNTSSAKGLDLPNQPLQSLVLSPTLFSEEGGGFGYLNVDNRQGTILVPEKTPLSLAAGGKLELKALNVNILSPITIPGGTISVTAYNYKPYIYTEQSLDGTLPVPILANSGLGIINVGPDAILNVSGSVFDERITSIAPGIGRRSLDGGTVKLEGYSILMDTLSGIDASGGGGINNRGKYTFGKGGNISILSGKDPNAPIIIGGSLTLPSTLKSLSANKGGTLAIQSLKIDVGALTTESHGGTLSLAPDFFQNGGFSNYDIKGLGLKESASPKVAVEVLPGVVITPLSQTLRPSTMSNLKGDFQLIPRLLPEGVRSPVGISLTASGYDSNQDPNVIDYIGGSLVMHAGSEIHTDPLGSVSLSADRLTVLGTIVTPGGKITLRGLDKDPEDPTKLLPTVHIGSAAKLVANGVTVFSPDPYGRKFGQVLPGGSIVISRGNIVAERGALMDVSGATDELDFTPSQLDSKYLPDAQSGLASAPWRRKVERVRVDSDGGLIQMSGSQMLLSDATLLGAAGGTSAVGGKLSISSGTFNLSNGLGQSTDITLMVSQTGAVIPFANKNISVGSEILDESGKPISGTSFLSKFSIDQFNKGGFASLDLGFERLKGSLIPYGGNIHFEGAISINAERSVRLASGGIIEAQSHVAINSPYIAIGQPLLPPQTKSEATTYDPFPSQESGVKPTTGAGTLSLQASLVDVGTLVLKNIGDLSISAKNGDVRGSGSLNVNGNINIVAGQIYPTTLGKFDIFAYGDSSVVKIKQSGIRSLPLSAGGSIAIYASKIENAGTLRAPFGNIYLGWKGEGTDPGNTITKSATPKAQNVTLTAGSETSVSGVDPLSGVGISVPFGYFEGTKWENPRGIDVTNSSEDPMLAGLPTKSIQIQADFINLLGGSKINLQGGGDLYASRWVSGVGGSVDILGVPAGEWAPAAKYSAGQQVSYNGRAYSARVSMDSKDFNGSLPIPGANVYWMEVPESYAVIPGFGFKYSPYDSSVGDKSDSAKVKMGIGDLITLESGSALPAGTYTLLPRIYANLPGAYLISPSTKQNTIQGNAEGVTYASGYKSNDFAKTKTISDIRSNFEVLTPEVFANRAEYEVNYANTYIPKQAAAQRISVKQLLPKDSANLVIIGNKGFALSGSVISPSIVGGRGASIDITSNADIYINGKSHAVNPTQTACVQTSLLNSWKPESLLIGGLRGIGDVISVNTGNIYIDNSGEALSAPEIILAASKSITLENGSQIHSEGSHFDQSRNYSISGDGAAIIASQDSSVSLTRNNLGTSTIPILKIGKNVNLSGEGLILDSTYGTSVDSSASVVANSLTLASGQISILLESPAKLEDSLNKNQLILQGDFLKQASKSLHFNLLSRSSLDIYGSGLLDFNSLNIKSSGIIGYPVSGDQVVQIHAENAVLAGNQIKLEPSTTGGSFKFFSKKLELAGNSFAVNGFSNLELKSENGIIAKGDGTLISSGSISITSPVLTVSQGKSYSIQAVRGLTIQNLGVGKSEITPELGGELSLTASSVLVNAPIMLPSGSLNVNASKGDINIGSKAILDLAGSEQIFQGDIIRYADAGTITMISDVGNISFDSGSFTSVAGNGARAGEVTLSAPGGSLKVASGVTLMGQAQSPDDSGSFSLDVNNLSELASINARLEEGGFLAGRNFRARTGDIVISNGVTIHSRDFKLFADEGSITISGTVDASGLKPDSITSEKWKALADTSKTGGSITIAAKQNLSVESTGILTVAAEKFNAAGKGGEISLSAGVAVDGAIDTSAMLSLEDGSQLDLSVAEFVEGGYLDAKSSASQGRFQGKIHLRAPRSADNNEINIAEIKGSISGASAFIAEGYKLYDLTGDGILNTTLRDQIHAENQAFLGTMDSPVNESIFDRLLPIDSKISKLRNLLVVTPGVEIINKTGDLTLGKANPADPLEIDSESLSSADWDLSAMRYGSKGAPGVLTLKAAGDIVFNNTLSDGFLPVEPDAINGNSALWLAALDKMALDQKGNLLRPINVQSWSYSLTSGADISSVDSSRVLSKSAIKSLFPDAGELKGSILVGEFYPAKTNTLDAEIEAAGGGYNQGPGEKSGSGRPGTTAAHIRIDSVGLTDLGTRFEVVRTGTGDILVNAANDVQLRNQFATIYTAGVALPDPTHVLNDGDFSVPKVTYSSDDHPEQSELGVSQQVYAPQWAMSGGDLKIHAGNDIRRVTQKYDADRNPVLNDAGQTILVNDSTHQITSNWLYRRGHLDSLTGKFGSITVGDGVVQDNSASTAWWVDYSNFFQGFGALGGGNVDMQANRNIVNADAVTPTNARMAGIGSSGNLKPSTDNLLEMGGGDLNVKAGGNIDGGLFYVERGQGRLDAGAQITTNGARSPSFGLYGYSNIYADTFADLQPGDPEILPKDNWVPVSLILGKGNFNVSAKQDVLLGPTVNAFLLPSGLGNQFWYKSYFSTYSPESRVDVNSLGGDVTLKTATFLPDGAGQKNVLQAWLEVQNLLKAPEINPEYPYLTTASYQPWTRLSETLIAPFEKMLGLAPAHLHATSFSGEVNIIGDILLSPAAQGNLEFAAASNINGLQPAGGGSWIYSTINISDANPSLLPAITRIVSTDTNVTSEDFLSSINKGLTESGSSKGVNSAIDIKLLRHGTTLLHANDSNPVKIYSEGGSFSGFTLYSPKMTRIIAGGDISDVSLYIQNAGSQDISLVSAGGDMVLYNQNSTLRQLAFGTEALPGDIQIGGPGTLEVLSGGKLDLGEGAPDDTNLLGLGITSIGNSRNPNLSFDGASIIAMAGVSGKNNEPARGLSASNINFEAVKNISPTSIPMASGSLNEEHLAINNLNLIIGLLKQTSLEYPDTGVYEPGLSAVKNAFSNSALQGDIFTRARNIRTSSGGSISIAAPHGALTMAPDVPSLATPPGIVTEYGGAVSIITDGNVDIGRCRIFTLRGGDMTIWSTTGDIAAGTSPKTVVTAPPTRVLVDSTSADIKTDLGGLVTGGGIGVLASVEGVPPGDVYLLAPLGTVDAGDAGIQSTGNLRIAAVSVLNADNIAASGASVGVPSGAPAAAAPAAAAPAASSTSAATSSAAQNVASQGQDKKESEDAPSLITVDILGYGGGEGDKEEDDKEKSASL
jgi:filamentous hemagglutinin family protein